MTSPPERAVITGATVVTPAGAGLDPLHAAVREGRTLLRHHGDEPWPTARVDDDLVAWPSEAPWCDFEKYAGRAARLIRVITDRVMESAFGGPFDPPRPDGGILLCMNDSDFSGWRQLVDALATGDGSNDAMVFYDELEDFHYLRTIPSQALQLACLRAGFEGGSLRVGRPALGGLSGLSLAERLIRTGELATVLVIGADPFPPPYTRVARAEVEPLAEAAGPGDGPFDRTRRGTWLAEAAVGLVIERAETAERRDARILGEVLACRTVCAETYAESQAAAIDATIDAGGVAPDVVWAHAAGRVERDAQEAEVLAGRFGAPVTATAGVVGDLSASGALLNVALALRFARDSEVPPVGLLREPDPRLATLDLVVGRARPHAGRCALITSADDPPGFSAGAALVRGPS